MMGNKSEMCIRDRIKVGDTILNTFNYFLLRTTANDARNRDEFKYFNY